MSLCCFCSDYMAGGGGGGGGRREEGVGGCIALCHRMVSVM